MLYCPDCHQNYAERIRKCRYCGGPLEEAEPDGGKEEWVEVYFGEVRWTGLVRRTLTDAGIPTADTAAREEHPGLVAYQGPQAGQSVLVPLPRIREAQKVLSDLRKQTPEAFPEGRL